VTRPAIDADLVVVAFGKGGKTVAAALLIHLSHSAPSVVAP
jgi:hypothetical protein